MSLAARKVKDRHGLFEASSNSQGQSCSFPKAFSLMKITGQGSSGEGRQLHKKLFDEEDVSASPVALPIFYQNYRKHRRVSSTIVKNIEQSYDFCDAVESSALDEDLSDISAFSVQEEAKHYLPKTQLVFDASAKRNSMFASTAEARTSRGNSGFEHYSDSEGTKDERYSTIYTLSSETPSKHTTQKSLETENDQIAQVSYRLHGGNTTTLGVSTVQTQEEIFEVELFKQSGPFNYEHRVSKSTLGLLPTRTFCFKCNAEVITDVTLRLPKVSFWRTMCCVGDLLGECNDTTGWSNFQEFQHYCVYCRSLLGAVNPANFR